LTHLMVMGLFIELLKFNGSQIVRNGELLMIVRVIAIFILLLAASSAFCGEKYEKQILLKMTTAQFYKYADTFDFDNDGHVWLLDADHGLVKVFQGSKKIHSFAVPTQDTLQFILDRHGDYQDGNSKNFHLRVDECGNFIIFTDVFPTKVMEFDRSGKWVKTGTLKMERFEDVRFFNGNIYSKPDGVVVVSGSPVDCPPDPREQGWNDFTTLKRNLYTVYGLTLKGSDAVLDGDQLKDKGANYENPTNIVRDVEGNVYVTIKNVTMDYKNQKGPGESWTESFKTYKFDKNLKYICAIPVETMHVDLEDGTVYGVEQIKSGDHYDTVFEKWSKITH
jgi:hypothetical protein